MKETDLAYEAMEQADEAAKARGVTSRTQQKGELNVTTVQVLNDRGAEAIGKPQGTYVTLDYGQIWQRSYEDFCRAAEEISTQLLALGLPEEPAPVLVIGLGNMDITPDSLGPRTASRIFVTRHLLEQDPALFQDWRPRSVSCIAPGVLGKTGVEAVEVVRGLMDKVRPSCLLVIDSLAARSISRLSVTLQMTDTGIRPGAGVGNTRPHFSRETLGVPVIGIGVPTVVSARTMAEDLLKRELPRQDEASAFFVTPKDIGHILEEVSKLLARGINGALHRGVDPEELERLAG
ncbi:MAG: GPR endopeptidase [Clostridia bacterium]|nr:GPR endopeptidase [Clostridia bacterium]